MTIFEKVNDRKLSIKYETGAHYQMIFIRKRVKVVDSEGIETFYSYEVANGIYNINWIEKDGMTASQILDFNTNKVYVFLTWQDDRRGSLLQQGIFEII